MTHTRNKNVTGSGMRYENADLQIMSDSGFAVELCDVGGSRVLQGGQ